MPYKKVRLNYIYMEPETRERFDLVCNELGWQYKQLVSQCIQAFFKVNRNFYIDAGLVDCRARGMLEEDYYRTLRDQDKSDLPAYLTERPDFGVTPLDEVTAIETEKEFLRKYDTLTLSGYNSVLLRVARIVDMRPLSQLVSRIVKQHFERYWENIYAPQIELDKACKFKS